MHRYALALGSNRRTRYGSPVRTLAAACVALNAAGVAVIARSPIFRTAAIGPAGRAFANAAVLVETRLDPPALLELLKRIERGFGRRPGRRWGPRALDLDIALWSGGRWSRRTGTRSLHIPHAGLPDRLFVLAPLATIAPGWRVPGTGRTVRQQAWRLTGRRPNA